MRATLAPVVCVGCGKVQSRFDDFGVVGSYVHCDTVDCRNTAFSMLEEDRIFGLSDSDDEAVILPLPVRLDRAA